MLYKILNHALLPFQGGIKSANLQRKKSFAKGVGLIPQNIGKNKSVNLSRRIRIECKSTLCNKCKKIYFEKKNSKSTIPFGFWALKSTNKNWNCH